MRMGKKRRIAWTSDTEIYRTQIQQTIQGGSDDVTVVSSWKLKPQFTVSYWETSITAGLLLAILEKALRQTLTFVGTGVGDAPPTPFLKWPPKCLA